MKPEVKEKPQAIKDFKQQDLNDIAVTTLDEDMLKDCLDKYRELNDKCDIIISKIKARRSKNKELEVK